MNNLESLKSELLYEYSEQEFNLWRSQNFYQHHNLPARTLIKTSQDKQNHRKTMLHITNQKTKAEITPLSPHIGRNLFNQEQKKQLPGPGFYDVPLRKYSSHCYIKKQEDFIDDKIAKRLKKRKLINECRGPGIYNPETAFTLSSRSKTATQGTFSRAPFNRLLMPEIKIENLYLASSESEQYLRNISQPEPGKYSPKKRNQTARKAISFKISMTKRSSLAKQDQLPGPGFYNWQKIFQRKLKDSSKQKAKIQYKFVYGHPN